MTAIMMISDRCGLGPGDGHVRGLRRILASETVRAEERDRLNEKLDGMGGSEMDGCMCEVSAIRRGWD